MTTTEPARSATDDGQPLQDLTACIDVHAPPERAAAAIALARASWRRLTARQLQALDRARLCGWVLDALRFLDGASGPGPHLAVDVADDPDGDGRATTVVRIAMPDGPFLLSTVHEELARLGLEAEDLMHPAFGVVRGDDGRVLEVLPARDATRRETYLLLDLRAQLDAPQREAVAASLRAVLSDAAVAVEDFLAMRDRALRIAAVTGDRARGAVTADGSEVDEVVGFLRWLVDDHFVFLGARDYALVDGSAVRLVEGSGLGILRGEGSSRFADAVPLADLPEAVRRDVAEGTLLRLSRTTRTSTVHRQARMVDVVVADIDEHGTVRGGRRLLGLLSQKAFAEPASQVPVLRAKLRAILEREDVVDHSYDERAIRVLFDSFPKEALFTARVEDLHAQLASLVEGLRDGRLRVLLRKDDLARTISALVTVPRERFSGGLRQDVQRVLAERFGARTVDYQLSMTERDQPLLHFTLHVDELPEGPLPSEELEADLARLLRTWADQFEEALAAERGAEAARQAAAAWTASLPAGYVEVTSTATALEDLAELEALDGPDAVRMRLVRSTEDPDGLLRFRLYKAGAGVELSRFVPLLESLGLVVVEEVPFTLDRTPLWGEAHIHDYGVRSEDPLDPATDGARVADAVLAMWRGRAAADALNRLVVRAELPWDDVAVLRAYRRYRRQVGTTYTEAYTDATLLDHPHVSSALLAYFRARFDPDLADRAVEEPRARHAALEALDRVERLDADRILRGFLGLIDATVRTNRWRGRPWLSLKLDSALVPGVPKPVPHREVFVYSTELEGVHLRGGPVARGGLRWSDRPDDFRTEVLGLMKAQMVKNAVIVPTGSKGGFVLRRQATSPADVRAEVERQYRTFIRGLLDVTDDVRDGAVVPPDRVLRADGDDPYLVVAADRGTATFSDVANGISEERGFWLGDAFASGGSKGYDHKAMGITARGAWVAVQRHFRELGMDVQAEPITVVGVGDMSGDVFGNAMLRSRAVELVAAFDHRDVFLDPDPDPEAAFDERQRLYDLPGSSWQDYDRTRISAGGGVWSRTAKRVPLSPQVRARLRIDAEQLSPPELIGALLRANVDLLFFGGIGTFVKAADEAHADVGDRANDAVRVDASSIGARVIGEGGNLAVTQRGRIAYARRGGRCNADFIDNVAGVDTSDREVNLKILLRLAIEAGELTAAGRDELLAAVTDDVAAKVLRDVDLQTAALSHELAHSPGGLHAYEQLMADLERRGRLDRGVEVLPSTDEVVARRAAGAGLVRPELAVLLAYAKVDLADALLASDVVDQAAFGDVLLGYFPAPVVARFGELAPRHRLAREIVATTVANDLVNRLGITYASRTAADLGCTVPQLVAGWWVARAVCGADGLWRAIEALDGVAEPELQLELKAEVDALVDACTRAYVSDGAWADVAAAVARDRAAFVDLAAAAGDLGTPAQRQARDERGARWVDLGVDEALVARIAVLRDLLLVPSIAAAARRSGRPVREVAEVVAYVADRLPLELLHRRHRAYAPSGRWQRAQHRGIADDLLGVHDAVSSSVLVDRPGEPPEQAVDAWLAERAPTVDLARAIARDVQRMDAPDLDAIAVGVRALQQLLA